MHKTWEWWYICIIPAFEKQRQEDPAFNFSLDHIVRLCLKKRKKRRKKKAKKKERKKEKERKNFSCVKLYKLEDMFPKYLSYDLSLGLPSIQPESGKKKIAGLCLLADKVLAVAVMRR
jgi:hypothetical protein